jgi:hypothetical protein
MNSTQLENGWQLRIRPITKGYVDGNLVEVENPSNYYLEFFNKDKQVTSICGEVYTTKKRLFERNTQVGSLVEATIHWFVREDEEITERFEMSVTAELFQVIVKFSETINRIYAFAA